jgi:hypothetical protein
MRTGPIRRPRHDTIRVHCAGFKVFLKYRGRRHWVPGKGQRGGGQKKNRKRRLEEDRRVYLEGEILELHNRLQERIT